MVCEHRNVKTTQLSFDSECPDWLQEAVTHLQALEEDLVDSHRNMILHMQQWANDDASLLAVTNEVDYDQEGDWNVSPIFLFLQSLNLNFTLF